MQDVQIGKGASVFIARANTPISKGVFRAFLEPPESLSFVAKKKVVDGDGPSFTPHTKMFYGNVFRRDGSGGQAPLGRRIRTYLLA